MLNKKSNFLKNKIQKLYIKVTFSNIFITLTDSGGNVIKKTSMGVEAEKGSRKKDKYNIRRVLYKILNEIRRQKSIKYLVYLTGPVSTYFFIRQIMTSIKFNILFIKTKSCVPFNGCRLKKKKRI